jgi:hypothetical protein
MRNFKKVPYKFLQLIIKSGIQMTSVVVSANKHQNISGHPDGARYPAFV